MAAKGSGGKTDTKSSRCWPGFEAVPGKSEHEQGSCRKKPASRNGGKEPDRETSRKKQVAAGGERGRQAKAKSPSASERRSVSKTAANKSANGRKSAGKKSTSGSKTASRKTASKSARTRVSSVAARRSS
jgi:hypothetical protein